MCEIFSEVVLFGNDLPAPAPHKWLGAHVFSSVRGINIKRKTGRLAV